jgi:two-component system, chemotaxis family, sensor kinase CheA
VDSSFSADSLLEMYLFETDQLIEQLDQSILSGEQSNGFSPPLVNEILRTMHTIKGSSAMMMYSNIASLAHSLEDLFYYIRENQPEQVDYSTLSDLVLEGSDFIKLETIKIKNGDEPDGDATSIIRKVEDFLEQVKGSGHDNSEQENHSSKSEALVGSPIGADVQSQGALPKYQVMLSFDEGCGMENVRAYSVVHRLQEMVSELVYEPDNILESEGSAEVVRQEGFRLQFSSEMTYDEVQQFFMNTSYVKTLQITVQEDEQIGSAEQASSFRHAENAAPGISEAQRPQIELKPVSKDAAAAPTQQSVISVSVSKLDRLMDLVGELVISEAMVTQNPELKDLPLDQFYKAARQLRKITVDIQDMVMSIRMVPLATTFHKMHRIVRDMSKKLDKQVRLDIAGEETEVDKNIIEQLSDPLMHMIRNAIDHGLEPTEERIRKGKSPVGRISLEARNAGGDVAVTIRDDGRGLDRSRILKKAKANGLLHKPEEEMTDKEVYSLIFLPGFSTNENVTEFSGRGVGMDVVTKNIEMVGGSVSVDSEPDLGTTILVKIPLTLAIINGMIIQVGGSSYTVPTISIRQSFRAKPEDLITDPDGCEAIMVRGQCYPILRLHKCYNVQTDITNIPDGIVVMVESEGKVLCLFADELIGEQQVVVKALPDYIKSFKKINGLAGCTLLGDGSISLILDVAGLLRLT